MLFGFNVNFSTSLLLILPFPVERVFFVARPGNGSKRRRGA
jgi:hypothetical protein